MKYRFKTKPYPHQVRALKMLLRNNGGGLQVPMRWGKSKVAVDFSAAMYYKRAVRRVLFVTVTSGLGVIQDEIAKHCPVPWQVMDHHGEVLAQSPGDPAQGRLKFVVVNFQNVYTRMNIGGRSWAAMPHPVLKKFDAELIIVDESHHIGNPSGEQNKHLRQLGRAAKYRVIMTGSMFHRKPFFVFGQALFYDNGASLGSAWTHYKKRVAIMGGYGGYEVQSYQNLDWMINQLKPWVYMEKYVPPGEPVINPIRFDLEGKNLKAYMDMYKDRVLELADGNVITAEIVLSMHLRLQQICGGYVKSPSGKYIQVGDNKLKVCEDRLSEYLEQGIEKAVVGCQFIPELRGVALVAKKLGFAPILLHGGVPKGKERHRRIARFQEIDRPALFISQIAAGKESIDLSVASTMMFYSMSQSYVEHDQFSKRIEKFEDPRRLMYDFLIARGSRDEVTYESLRLKEDVARFIVTNPKLVEQLTAKVEGTAKRS